MSRLADDQLKLHLADTSILNSLENKVFFKHTGYVFNTGFIK